MWVQVREWVLVEGERSRPTADSILRAAGLRVRGVVTAAEDTTPDGVAELREGVPSDANPTVQTVTGTAGEVHDVWSNTKRFGRGDQSGAEFVLTVGSDRFQVQFAGDASDVRTGSRVTVTGALELVGDYEWGAFGLADTREDWKVVNVIDLPGGDLAIDLTHPPVL